MKNSKHFYERLNFNIDLFKPVIKYENHLFKIGVQDEIVKRDCVKLKSDTVIILKGKAPLGQPCPSIDVPIIVIFYYNEMLRWYNEYKLKNLMFVTLTVPPSTKIVVHKKKIEYGCVKNIEQLRYLRNKIYEFWRTAEIDKYIIVFEITKLGVIHAHMLYVEPDDYSEGYKDLAHIMGYNTYKKQTVNVVESKAFDEGIIDYLCKIEN